MIKPNETKKQESNKLEKSTSHDKEGQEYLKGLARWALALSQPEDLMQNKILCVDTDIVTMFSSPSLGAGYTALKYKGAADKVDAKDSSLAAALTGELARYILFELEDQIAGDFDVVKAGSRLVLPGHAQEIERLYFKSISKAEKAFSKVDDELVQLTELAEKVASKLSSSEQSSSDSYNSAQEKLVQAITEFVEYWLDPKCCESIQAIETATRMAELLATNDDGNGRLVNITRYRFAQQPFLNSYQGFLPDYTTSSAFLKRYEELCGDMKIPKQIVTHKKEEIEGVGEAAVKELRQPRSYKHATDAYALAWLEQCNKLAERENKPDPLFVIISGAQLLKNIGQDIVVDPLFLMPSLLRKLKIDKEARAVDELRRLVNGILYPVFQSFKPEKSEPELSFLQWCARVLDNHRDTTGLCLKNFDGLAEVEEEWRKLSEIIAAKSNKKNSLFDEIYSLLPDPHWQKNQDSWLKQISDIFTKSKRSLITKVSLLQPSLSFGMLQLPRNPPPVRLEKFPEAKKLADDSIFLAQGIQGKNLQPSSSENESRFNLPNDSAKQYLTHLLTGLQESAVGNWELARLIFWVAYENGVNNSCKEITGRDAAYAFAISCRITMTYQSKEMDIKKCKKYLARAKELDLCHARPLEEDIRFSAETLALELSQVWLALSRDDDEVLPNKDVGPPVNAKSIRERSYALFQKIQQLKAEHSPECNDEYLVEYVVQQTLCVITQAWLLEFFCLASRQEESKQEQVQLITLNPHYNRKEYQVLSETLHVVEQSFATQRQLLEPIVGPQHQPRRLPTLTPLAKILTIIVQGRGDTQHIGLKPHISGENAKNLTKLCEDGKNWNFEAIDSYRRLLFKKLLSDYSVM